jgi:ectoine hydroxylase-related dioxygenase (phytanoyl-CoA dioxygenase family)
LKKDLVSAIEAETEFHKGKSYRDYGMVLACPMYSDSFSELLASDELMAPINSTLGESSLVYAYTSSSMPPSESNYSARIHVDSPRVIPGYPTNLGIIVLLDDFTEENGATYFLPQSHERLDQPSEEEFFKNAKRLIAKAGSVCYFNSRTWHAGGVNKTKNWRHALTINMCRGYMRQRLNFPSFLSGRNVSHLPEKALQKLGFFAQAPGSLDEYYLPPEKRKFRQKTE